MQNIHAAIELPDPSELPRFIESAEEYLPKKIPAVDICVATGIHQDLLLALPSRLKQEGIEGLIAPIEDFREVDYYTSYCPACWWILYYFGKKIKIHRKLKNPFELLM